MPEEGWPLPPKPPSVIQLRRIQANTGIILDAAGGSAPASFRQQQEENHGRK
ncbi:hypothetical protein [Glutamicibacter arilaitensis]|uniref:hypothetical protein n=1 Tax=Glutamicibacter arilaitensis TaxID=256701 RepID=UPI003F8DCD4C